MKVTLTTRLPPMELRRLNGGLPYVGLQTLPLQPEQCGHPDKEPPPTPDHDGNLVPLPSREQSEDPPFVPNKFGEHD